MLKLALAPYPQFSIDQRELDRPTPSYMIDTLQSLKAEYGVDTSFTLIIGMDNFQHFHRWRDWETILRLSNLIVLERPNTDSQGLNEALKKTRIPIRDNPHDLFAGHGQAYFCDAGYYDISSTAIRRLLQNGKIEGRYLQENVPANVLSYIQNRKLYS